MLVVFARDVREENMVKEYGNYYNVEVLGDFFLSQVLG